MKIGYARVSTQDQDLSLQVQALENAGCELVYQEKASGTSTNDRVELQNLLKTIRKGDVVVITRIDRLARSLNDFSSIVGTIKTKGAELIATDQAIDTSGPDGRAMIGMLAVFAEFETDIRKERQMEGIRRAQAAGIYKGRKASIDVNEVRKLKAEGHGATAIANKLGIGRASVYRVLKETES